MMKIGKNTLTFKKDDVGYRVDLYTSLYNVYVDSAGVVLTKKDNPDKQYYIANKKVVEEIYKFKGNKDKRELTVEGYVHKL
jgi:hypothetical protein